MIEIFWNKSFSHSEAVAQRYSVKKVLLEISQNSQENTCTRGSFLIKKNFIKKVLNFIKKEYLAQVFFCEFCEVSKNTFFTEHLRWLLLLIIDQQNSPVSIFF